MTGAAQNAARPKPQIALNRRRRGRTAQPSANRWPRPKPHQKAGRQMYRITARLGGINTARQARS